MIFSVLVYELTIVCENSTINFKVWELTAAIKHGRVTI